MPEELPYHFEIEQINALLRDEKFKDFFNNTSNSIAKVAKGKAQLSNYIHIFYQALLLGPTRVFNIIKIWRNFKRYRKSVRLIPHLITNTYLLEFVWENKDSSILIAQSFVNNPNSSEELKLLGVLLPELVRLAPHGLECISDLKYILSNSIKNTKDGNNRLDPNFIEELKLGLAHDLAVEVIPEGHEMGMKIFSQLRTMIKHPFNPKKYREIAHRTALELIECKGFQEYALQNIHPIIRLVANALKNKPSLCKIFSEDRTNKEMTNKATVAFLLHHIIKDKDTLRKIIDIAGNNTLKEKAKIRKAVDILVSLQSATNKKQHLDNIEEILNLLPTNIKVFGMSMGKFARNVIAGSKMRTTVAYQAGKAFLASRSYQKSEHANYVGQILEDHTFFGAISKKSDFRNATLRRVDFSESTPKGILNFGGTIMDPYTLLSISRAIQKSPKSKFKFNLEGCKLVGALVDCDLSNVALEQIDMSRVSRFFNVKVRIDDPDKVLLPEKLKPNLELEKKVSDIIEQICCKILEKMGCKENKYSVLKSTISEHLRAEIVLPIRHSKKDIADFRQAINFWEKTIESISDNLSATIAGIYNQKNVIFTSNQSQVSTLKSKLLEAREHFVSKSNRG